MDSIKTVDPGAETKVEIDLSGLLGCGQVFAAGSDPKLQAELIDANCNKIGGEGCCCGQLPPS